MSQWNTSDSTAPRSSAKSARRRRSRSREFSTRQSRWTLADLLLRVSEISFYLTFLLVLLAFAGRSPLGQICLLLGTLLSAGTWIWSRLLQSERSWRWTGLEPLFVLGVCLLTFQLLTLPPAVRNAVSPALATLTGADLGAAAESADETASSWSQLTLTPHATRLSLAAITCVTLLLIMLTDRFRDRAYARRVTLGCTWGVVLFSVFAVAQLLTSNGDFLWLFRHPYTTTETAAKGTFANPNHFAGFASLAVGPILAWTLSRQKGPVITGKNWNAQAKSSDNRLFLGSLAMIALVTAVLLSKSRGGLVLVAVALGLSLVGILWRRLAGGHVSLGLAAIALCALGGVTLFGQQHFEQNVGELISAEMDSLDGKAARRFIWKSNLAAQQQFRWVGTGLGSHREVIPAFHDRELEGMVYTHAENSYLQILTETGLAGAAIALALLSLVIVQTLRRAFGLHRDRRDLPIMLGIVGSLGVFATHGTYDFGWYTPAYMLLLAVYVAFVVSCPADERESASVEKASGWGMGPVLLAGGLFAGIGLLAPSVWNAAVAEIYERQYLIVTRDQAQVESVEDELLGLRRRIQLLQSAIQADSSNGIHYDRLAFCLRRVFELNQAHDPTQMPVSQVRAAVYAGGFEETEQLQRWLNNPGVMGKCYALVQASLRSARRAVQFSPCSAGAWLIQSDLCFLDSPDPEIPDYYLERARRIAPKSTDVTFTTGFHAWSRGDVETAIQLWQQAFPHSRLAQRRILALTSPSFGPEELIEFFQPDLLATQRMLQAYSDPRDPRYLVAANRLVDLTFENASAVSLMQQEKSLLRAFQLLRTTDDRDSIDTFIARATSEYADSIVLRKSFGYWYFDQKLFAQALAHLEYYANRVGHDPDALHRLSVCRQQTGAFPARTVTPAALHRTL